MNVLRNPRTLAVLTVLAAALWRPAPAAAQVDPCPKPANLPPANSPVLLRCMQLVAHPVNETIVEQATYDFYIKTPRTDSGHAGVGAVQRRRHPGRLLEPVADELSRQPLDRGHRRAVRERRHGQARRLPHRRAAAAQGRRLRAGRRHEDEGRGLQDRRGRCASRTSTSRWTGSSTRRRCAASRASSGASTPRRATTTSRSRRRWPSCRSGPSSCT